MKLKGVTKKIFNLNISLRDVEFNEIVEFRNKWFFIGKIESEDEKKFEAVKVEFKPIIVKKLNYLYHVKRMESGTLKYKHLAYVKATFWQHSYFTIQRVLGWLYTNPIGLLTVILTLIKILEIIIEIIHKTSPPLFGG